MMPSNTQAKKIVTDTAQKSDPNSHLSDHEWRLKMAAEGKAIYVPGQPIEELIAKEAERRASLTSRIVGLTDDEWNALDTAIPDVLEVIYDVRNVFRDLADMHDLDRPAVNSIMRLAARAVLSMKDRELQVLDRLDTAVRTSQLEAAQ
jgi:hypothetical protein